jgi:molecular chaperone GrpE (heat shock protein)
MSLLKLFAAWFARLVALFRPRSRALSAAVPGSLTAVDAAEEFAKLQRGLRRLSLASDRSGELIDGVAARLDEIRQTLEQMRRPPQVALSLKESDLLQMLDQLHRAAAAGELPAAARAAIEAVQSTLLAGAGWTRVTAPGARAEDTAVRIAEFVGEMPDNPGVDIRVHRVLEQGYRRADGALLRPGVVIAAAASAPALGH